MEIPWINEIEQADANGIIPPHGQNSPDIPVFAGSACDSAY